MTDNYKTICDELDALTLTYLSKVSEYIELCKDNSNHFQKVYILDMQKKKGKGY